MGAISRSQRWHQTQPARSNITSSAACAMRLMESDAARTADAMTRVSKREVCKHVLYIHAFECFCQRRSIRGVIHFIPRRIGCGAAVVPVALRAAAGAALSVLSRRHQPDDLTRQDEPSTWKPNGRVVALAFAFVLGFATVFVALGASASLIGKAVTAHFQTLGIIAGVSIVLLGLHFLGVFQDRASVSRSALPDGPQARRTSSGPIWSGSPLPSAGRPASGPVLAAILMVAGVEGSAVRGALLLGAYALGIGIPFLLASLFSAPFMRLMVRLRGHMRAIEMAIGGALVMTGVLFLTGGMPQIAGWLLETFPAFGSIG